MSPDPTILDMAARLRAAQELARRVDDADSVDVYFTAEDGRALARMVLEMEIVPPLSDPELRELLDSAVERARYAENMLGGLVVYDDAPSQYRTRRITAALRETVDVAILATGVLQQRHSALRVAVAALCGGNADYRRALWDVVSSLDQSLAAQLERDPHAERFNAVVAHITPEGA